MNDQKPDAERTFTDTEAVREVAERSTRRRPEVPPGHEHDMHRPRLAGFLRPALAMLLDAAGGMAQEPPSAQADAALSPAWDGQALALMSRRQRRAAQAQQRRRGRRS